jgi:hypothetical protein
VNSYEIGILRILVKRQAPIKIPDLISGFPDNSQRNVLHAISNLHSLGYVLIYGDYFPGYLLLTKEKRREAIEIISSNITKDNQIGASSYSEQLVRSSIKKNRGTSKTFMLFATMGVAALSIIIISGLAIILASSPPSSDLVSLYPSHYISTDRPSSSPISVFTCGDQYPTRSTSIPELAGQNAFVVVRGMSELATKPMVNRVSTANTNNSIL